MYHGDDAAHVPVCVTGVITASLQPWLGLYHTCKFHSGGRSVFTLGMEHSGIDRYRCTIPDFIILKIYEYTYT